MNISAQAPVVECRKVWKVFGGNERSASAVLRSAHRDKFAELSKLGFSVAVADASFAVGEGEIFCIMGLSGSGKSTLLRHVNGLIQPSAGQVLIGGVDIATQNPQAMRAMRADTMGMVFQSFALMPHLSVIENVALGLEFRRVPLRQRLERAAHVLELVRLSQCAHRMPSELSGGMQQRVGLARALAGDPQILLMDEPFSALDPIIRRQLQDEFLQLSQVMRKTTIFITHDMDEALRIGSRIAIMRQGQIVQTGTPKNIAETPADDYVAAFLTHGDTSRRSPSAP